MAFLQAKLEIRFLNYIFASYRALNFLNFQKKMENGHRYM